MAIPLELDEGKVTVDAYILELGGIDLILGVGWSETLGKVIMDWKEMTMTFKREG